MKKEIIAAGEQVVQDLQIELRVRNKLKYEAIFKEDSESEKYWDSKIIESINSLEKAITKLEDLKNERT